MKRVTALLFFIFGCLILEAHPLKMAYTSVKYNAVKQVFEISHRVFQDDFEATLQSNYQYAGGDVFINQLSPATRKTINTFFEKNFSISFNNKKVQTRLIKIEQKQQMGIVVWYETEPVKAETVNTIQVYNQIMMESFSEQVNMFSLNIKDEIKRTLKFELGKTRETLSI